MDWFRQIFAQGVVISLIATLLIHLPWAWAKFFLAFLLVFLLLMMGNNPLFFFRKLARAIVLASIGSLVLGLNAQLAGNASLPLGLGAIKFIVETGSTAPGWVALILAICALADFGLNWLGNRSSEKLVGTDTLIATVWKASQGGILIIADLVIAGQKGGLTLAGAQFAVRDSLGPPFTTRLLVGHHGGPQTDVEAGATVHIQAGATLGMSVEAEARRGLSSRYVMKRLDWTLGLFPVTGRLKLRRDAGAKPILLPVKLVRSSARDA